MNTNYIVQYVDVTGKVTDRSTIARIRMILYAGTKFFFDRLLALIGLIVLSPIMLIIAIAIKIEDHGPALFKQTRTGKHGKNFTLYKFRSMRVDNDVHDFSTADAHTKVGSFLRKTSLDEIPQLISILTGKMSFIGPRPWITDYFDNMNETQRNRYCVRPGLTGLAQCMGRNNLTIFDKINYDLEYVKNYSFKQDFKIIFLTIKQVFAGSGTDAGKSTIEDELKALKKCNK